MERRMAGIRKMVVRMVVVVVVVVVMVVASDKCFTDPSRDGSVKHLSIHLSLSSSSRMIGTFRTFKEYFALGFFSRQTIRQVS